MDTWTTHHMVNNPKILNDASLLCNPSFGSVSLPTVVVVKDSYVGSTAVLNNQKIHNDMCLPEFQHNFLSVSKLGVKMLN